MVIPQTRILERVSMPSSRGSSQPRDRTQVSCIADGFFTFWATRKALLSLGPAQMKLPQKHLSWPSNLTIFRLLAILHFHIIFFLQKNFHSSESYVYLFCYLFLSLFTGVCAPQNRNLFLLVVVTAMFLEPRRMPGHRRCYLLIKSRKKEKKRKKGRQGERKKERAKETQETKW